jgi:hypothetical protein
MNALPRPRSRQRASYAGATVETMTILPPNKRTSGNGAMRVLSQTGRLGRAVPECERWAEAETFSSLLCT